jgi:hypothetical protein
MTPHQLPGTFLSFGEKFNGLAFDIDPTVFSEALKGVLAAIDLAALNDLIPGEHPFFPERPNALKDLVFFFYLRQHAQRRMACLSFTTTKSLTFSHITSPNSYIIKNACFINSTAIL